MKQKQKSYGFGTLVPHAVNAGLSGILRLLSVFMLLLASAGGWAASDSGVKFNKDVRYSQWAINSRAGSFYANTTSFGLATYQADGSLLSARNDSKQKLDYVPGLVSKAIIETADFYQDFDWSKPWFLTVKEYGEAYYKDVPNTGGSLDDLNAVKLYIGVYNNKYATDDDKSHAKTAIDRAKAGLIAHNTGCSLPSGTLAGDGVVGGWFHKSIYNNQMWLDGAYMGSALLGQLINFYGTGENLFGSKTADWQMAAKQLNIVWNMCWNSSDKLMYHAFEANAGTASSKSNAETWDGLNGKTSPYTFHSAAYWGRANAWYFYALVDVLEAMKNDGQGDTDDYKTLKQHLTDLAAGILARQDSETGGWYQLLDKDASFEATEYNSSWKGKPAKAANYIETSATALFSSAFFKAVRLELLGNDYKTAAKKAFEGLVNKFTYLDKNNDMEIWGSCKSAGLGGDGTDCVAGGKKYRNGSDAYYLLGYDVPMVKSTENLTEGKVLGGFIMAATEYERAYQNQDSKQILFSRDLASSYDLTQSGATAPAVVVCGTNADQATYQWYDATTNTAVDGATEASFTPSTNGNYYCKATVNGTTIQTSNTNIKVTASSGGDDNNGGETPAEGTTLFNYTVPLSATTLPTTDTETTGGKISFATDSSDKNGYKLDNDTKKYVKVTLSDNVLQPGDVISVLAYSSKAGTGGYIVSTDQSKTKTKDFGSLQKEKEETISYTVTDDASDILNGQSSFYLFKSSAGSIFVKSIKIIRKASSGETTQTDLSATFDDVAKTMGDADFAPAPTSVKAGETALDASAYSVSFSSGNTEVVSVVNGKLHLVAPGTSTITATVTPTEASKYKVATATFTVTVAKRQYAVTATASPEAAGSVTIKNGETSLTSGASVDEGANLTFTATANSGYDFNGWTVNGTASQETGTALTLNNISAATRVVANFTKQQTVVTESTVIYEWNTTVGSITAKGASSEAQVTLGNQKVSALKLNSNYNVSKNTQTSIIPATEYGGFKAGDIITVKGFYTSNRQVGVEFHTAATDGDADLEFKTPNFTSSEQEFTFTLTTDCDALHFGRYGGGTPYVTGLKVVRPAATTKQLLTAQFAEKNLTVLTTKGSVTLPDLTVKDASGNVVDASKYTVACVSNDESVATVANGKITINNKVGVATITATVTPTDADKYASCTASLTVNVRELTPLSISVADVDMNVTDNETAQPEVRVYDASNLPVRLNIDYTLSFKSANEDVVTVNSDGKLIANGEAYNWKAGTTTVTVTATPKETLGETYTAGSATFTFTVSEGKMKPVFLQTFKDATIKVKKGSEKSFEVPLNYAGEKVSDKFDITYTSSPALTKPTVKDGKLTCKFSAEGEYKITVSATPKVINQGKDTDFDYGEEYDSPDAITFTVDVKDSYIAPKVAFSPAEAISIYVGDKVDAPAISVTDANGQALAEGSYTVTWASYNPSVCKVNETTGELEGVSEGDNAQIRIVVKGDNLESTTAFINVSVDDPAKYRVKSPGIETFSPFKPILNQDKTLATTLGGWVFDQVSTNSGITSEGLFYGKVDKKTNQWADKSSSAQWNIPGYNYMLASNSCNNARQEDGCNPLPSETKWYNGTLKTVDGKGVVDPMFYVPCSGAYFQFEPKVNGRVSVSVYQNGVFDKANGQYGYRPQRRVFVLDEAGNVVSSSAKISATQGKLSPLGKSYTAGGDNDPNVLANYPCNIEGLATGTKTTGGKSGATAYPSPTADEVAKAFRGMTTFDISKFQNNVYESNIDNAKDWGDAASPNNGGDDEVKGSHGWSVLVDAAVTYSFDVKAGKTYYIYNYGSKLGFYGFTFDEEHVEAIDDISYTQAGGNNVEKTPAGHMAKVKIDRVFKGGMWNAAVLPFSLNKQQVDAIFGHTYDKENPDGTEIIYFDRIEGSTIHFHRHAYNTIVAGKPFLIKPAREGEFTINTADVADFPYVTIENTKPEDWCAGSGYSWVSDYNTGTMYNGDYYLSTATGDLKRLNNDNGRSTIKGFRGYLKLTDPQLKANALKAANSSSIEGNETDWIDGVITDIDEFVPALPTDGKIYNINGQLVSPDASKLGSLPSGLYIVNGKKVVK